MTPSVTPAVAQGSSYLANTDYTATAGQVTLEFVAGAANEAIDCTWTAMP